MSLEGDYPPVPLNNKNSVNYYNYNNYLQIHAVLQGVNLLLACVNFVLKRITDSLLYCVSGSKVPNGGLQLSFVVVLIVAVQLYMAVSISRAVIFLLLMTSGDVERNPGPQAQFSKLPFL